jgi:hypothetical protein
MKRNNRWYDANRGLAAVLEKLKSMKSDRRDKVVSHVIGLINERRPGLLEKYLLDFPLDQKRRRWYDRDPYLWLMVNVLRYAGVGLLRRATAYMARAVAGRAGTRIAARPRRSG